jgi:hypothetical protein
MVALGKAAAFAAAPLLYHVGVWGQSALEPVLKGLAAIPVIGLTDFSRYAVVGGLVLGLVIGSIGGLVLAWAVTQFRRKWLKLEEGSEKFRRWHDKGWVKFFERVLVGRRARSVRKVLSKRPRYVRKVGVILAVILVVGCAIGLKRFQDELARRYVTQALTRVNGAEVNIDRLDLAALAGRIMLAGIAVTDPEQPAQNRISIGELAADASVWNLLLGRVVVSDLAIRDVRLDEARATPGYVLPAGERWQPPALDFDPSRYNVQDAAKLEQYFKDARRIRERLNTLREYIPAGTDEQAEEQKPPVPEHYLAYLQARAPVPPAPRVIVERLTIEGVPVEDDLFGRCNITGENFSDRPEAARRPVTVEVQSTEQPTVMKLVSHYERPEGGAEMSLSFENVDLAEFQKQRLSSDNPMVFESGTASGVMEGDLTRETMDMALKVKAKDLKTDATGGLAGLDPRVSDEVTKVLENIETSVRLVGPIIAPRVIFDSNALREEFQEALVEAGKGELARQIDLLAKEHAPGMEGVGGKILESPTGAVEGILGGLSGQGQSSEDEDKEEEKEKERQDPLSNLRRNLNR